MDTIQEIPVPVRVDTDALYQAPGYLKKFLWGLFIFILPDRFLAWIFTASSSHTRLIKENAKNHRALELMYTYKFEQNGKTWRERLDGFCARLWEENVINAAAVRNRLRLVKKEVRKAITERKMQEKIRVLSIAAGSARAIVECLQELKRERFPVEKIEARFVDLSREAINYSKKLAADCGVSELIEWKRADVREVAKYCNGWRPDVVEMVGLLDYFDEPEALNISDRIYKILVNGGVYITCNVTHNLERKFVTNVVDWEMHYKNSHQLAEMLTGSGFDRKHCRIVYEPCKIHCLAIATKSP